VHGRGAEIGRLLECDRLSIAMLWLTRAVLAAFLILLAFRAGHVVLVAIEAISFPLDLDYGEGIVLQQALLILTDRAYGDINSYPFIVFHYPPVYHLVVRCLTALGCDLVVAGRTISVVATVAISGIVGLLVHGGLSSSLTQRARLFGAAAGGLAVFAFLPVALWMPFARVDMLAIAFSLAGLLCAARAPGSRVSLHAAVLFFVLAVFTKQTSVAAPAAAVLMLLITNRADGFRMIAAGLALGLTVLGLAMLLTEGRFLSHLITYNINRYDLGTARKLFAYLIFHLAFLSLAAAALGQGWHDLRRTLAGAGLTAYAKLLRSKLPARIFLMLVIHFIFSGAMLLLVVKSGAGPNYFIPWLCTGAALLGLLFGRVAGVVTGSADTTGWLTPLTEPAFAVCGIVQLLILPDPIHPRIAEGAESRLVAEELIREVRDADRPVISDDMVLLLQAGKEVPWEPAIFAELASIGRWDESLIIYRIRSGSIAFVVTVGTRGQSLFDSRYNSPVADVIDQTFPRKVRRGWLTLHLPPG
jgi:hypothetical protein